jgi:hypothetical protein
MNQPNPIKKSKDIIGVFSNHMDSMGFMLRWVTGILSILWGFMLAVGIWGMWKFDKWNLWYFLIFPAFLFVVQVRTTWRYRMFKPKDLMTYSEVEEELAK